MLARESFGHIQALVQGREVFGVFRPLMYVRCFAVDGLLIDTGLACFSKEVLAFAREHRVRHAVITHHHEDHSGNAKALQSAGIEVAAPEETGKLLQEGFFLYPYQHLSWGAAPKTLPGLLGSTVETEHHRFQVLPAPGHSADQVVLYEPSEGWLFSGDAFIAERIKFFRGDEDFAGTLETVRRLCTMDFEALYCAHRPVEKQGREAMKRKLDYLENMEGKVKELVSKGRPYNEICKEVLGKESMRMVLISTGDVSKANIVHSIVYGPKMRISPWSVARSS